MLEISKKPIVKNRSLFNDERKKEIDVNHKLLSQNNLNLITKNQNQNHLKDSSKKCSNIIDFIKQKNKFFIEDSFDAKGTREFLASKEVAMRVIKLNDEIIEENENSKGYSITQKNLIKIDKDISEDKHKSTKIINKRTISPRKSRKKHKLKSEKDLFLKEENFSEKKKIRKSIKKNKNKSNINNSNNSSDLESNINSKINSKIGSKINSKINSKIHSKKSKNLLKNKANDSNEEDIQKFVVEDEKGSEEHFHKKLKRELKKVENNKKNHHHHYESVPHRKSLSKKDLKYKRPKRMNSVIIPKARETQSIFLFSEITKNLMKKDEIDLSSISDNDRMITSPKKANKKKRAFGSVQFNNIKIKEKIKNEIDKNIEYENEDLNNDAEKKVESSEKDSLISILSDLM